MCTIEKVCVEHVISFIVTILSIPFEFTWFPDLKAYHVWILSSIKIQDMQLFKDNLVVYEREEGLPRVTIYGLPNVGEPLKSLQVGHRVDFIDPIYSVEPSESQFVSSILRFEYSSMKTPHSVYDYDMKTGISVLKKIEAVSFICKSFSNYCVFH